ncbi:phosphatidylglycerophosphatase [Sulfuricella denitrificans skB26]|uniref:Phosphatidylglycerophosphatase A n=1 Tax=Sulfuricella denitrificans (strain DSM 22764 / NBRC 105220 / skB26) TaxID=1163617 RepID=S6B1Z9_SULDS|nr:phosphatidylglycerophosphatase A [Sulfuricella denitrificans]BAN34687.1 phosphatidylglycerophosphatase [Sulfuricella denitrificans skB26]
MTNNTPTLRFVIGHPAHFFAFGFGAGLSPYAPGTVGTLVAFPLFFLLRGLDPVIYFSLVAVLYAAGIWFCEVAGKSLGVSDHGGIVWDEIVAFLLVLHFSPPTLLGYALAFGLFRLFDIWKPFPIRYADQRIHGGFGVMFDDLLAAIYAVAGLLLLVRWGVI